MMWRFHQCQRVVRHGTVNHVQHAFKQHLPTGNKSSQLRFFSGASSSDSVSYVFKSTHLLVSLFDKSLHLLVDKMIRLV